MASLFYLELIKPLREVKYLGYYLDNCKTGEDIDEKERQLGAPTFEDKNFQSWFINQQKKAWSDNNCHPKFMWGKNILNFYCRGNNRPVNRLYKKIKNYVNNWYHIDNFDGYMTSFAPCKHIYSLDYVLLDKSFCKKSLPIYYATSKTQMIKFFDKYYKAFKGQSAEQINKEKEKFINLWEDGMIFSVTYSFHTTDCIDEDS